MRRRRTVLVTCMGSTNALSIVKALRDQDEYETRIAGVDLNAAGRTAGARFCDHFETVPPIRMEARYIRALRDLVSEHDVDLVFPILDEDVAALGRHRDEFPAGRLQLPPQATIELAIDKLAMHAFLTEHGFGSPATVAVRGAADAREAVEREGLDFPLMVKPRRGSGTKGVYEARSPGELVLVERLEEPLVQARARGDELTVDVFADGRGGVVAVPRVREDTRAGQIYVAHTERDAQLIAEAERLARALELCGPANLQCFRDGGALTFTDVNPRSSGGLPITTAAGINIPLLALRLADGLALEPGLDFADVSMCRYWGEVIRESDSG